ncbi:MAG: protein kinase [Planctomycetes bacterium]|nr:protein kinase [Planctomycetota bacterium]
MNETNVCVNGHPLTDQDQNCPICGTVPMGAMFAPPRPMLPTIPGYEITEELGKGGMGVVYKARHEKLQRWVALKMIRNWSLASAEEQARFRVEAQAIAQLQHPHIVQIFEIGDWQGMPFLSLEFIEGGTLESKLKGQPMAPLEAAMLMRRIVEPIAFAHREGILHRDLKPANILLTANGEPKIGDFGLAKKIDSGAGLTHTDAVLGTPCYMAPEQAQRRNRTIGPTADLYALGVILYQMLTGRPPFLGESALETLRQVLEDEPVPPRRLLPRVPRDLETICLKCLRKEPEHRYASAADLAHDLENFVEGKPILARPISRGEIAWRWCRRNPLPASLTALLLTVFLVAFGLVAWKWQEAEHERELKDNALGQAQQQTQTAQAATSAMKLARDNAKEEAQAKAIALKEAEEASNAKQKALKETEAAYERLEQTSYLFAVRTAHRVWEDGDVLLAESLLSQIRPGLRRWEWDFLRNLHRSHQVSAFRNFSPTRSCVVHSPDGKTFAYVGNKGFLAIRDATTGVFLHSLKGHTMQVNCLAFSPDSKLLAAGDSSKTVIVWDITSRQIKQKLQGLPGPISSVAISRDGKRLAFGWKQGCAVRSLGDPTAPLPGLAWEFNRSDFTNLVFSPDSRFLATGNANGEVEILDLDNARNRQQLAAHENNCLAVAYAPDGQHLITGGADGLVKVWDADKKTWLRTHEGNLSLITGLSISADGRLLAVGSLDSVIRVYEFGKGTELALLRGHESAVTSVSLSSDGQHLLSTADDNSVRTWSLTDREGVSAYTNRNAWLFTALAAKSQRLFVAERDPERIWSIDLKSSEPLATKKPVPIALDHVGAITQRRLAASADGEWLALADATPAGRENATHIVVWSTRTGEVKTMLNVAANSVLQIAFHPTRPHLLATSEKKGTVTLWNLDDPNGHRTFDGCKGDVHALDFSSNGRWLFAGGKDKIIHVWDTTKPTEVAHRKITTPGTIHCIAVNPQDDQRVAFWAGKDGLAAHPIQIADWERGVIETNLLGHRQAVVRLAFDQTGKRLLSAGRDNHLRIWDLALGQELVRWPSRDRLFPGAPSLAFSPDGRFALCTGLDAVSLWNGASNHELWILRRHTSTTTGVAFSPDGRRVISGSIDASLRAWDAERGREIRGAGFPHLKVHKSVVNSVAYSPDGTLLATGGADRTAIVLDARTGQKRWDLIGHEKSVRWVAFNPDGGMLLTASNDKSIKLWNPRTGKHIHTLLGHEEEVNTAIFHPKKKLLASCSVDGTVRLWNTATGKATRKLPGRGKNMTDVAFSLNGTLLAGGDRDGWIIVWDEGGKERARFQAHPRVLQSLAFHPKFHHVLLSVGDDAAVRIWDLRPALDNAKANPIALATLRGHSGNVMGLAIRHDGQRLATTGSDRTVRIWDLSFLERPARLAETRK